MKENRGSGDPLGNEEKMEKEKQTASVISQKSIAPGIYDLWLQTSLAKEAHAGQFIGVYPKDRSTLLPRPISICEVSEAKDALRLVYRVVGQGTGEFSGLAAGDTVEILGILGNGFPLAAAAGKRAVLMGGGIGIPPMVELAKELATTVGSEDSVGSTNAGSNAGAASVDAVMGYRDGTLFLDKELSSYATLHIATEDGSVGTKGNVIDAICAEQIDADVIFACGPMPMLRAIKQYAEEKHITAYISLEEHMACGVGACLGCVVKTKEIDAHSHVYNARICTDGPVFDAKEVEI